MADDVKLWCAKEISKFLGTDVGQEFTNYLFSIENVADVEEYLFQLLDSNDDKVTEFVRMVCQNWQVMKKPKAKPKTGNKGKAAPLSPKLESRNGVKKQTVFIKGEQSPSKKKGSHFVSLYSDEGIAKTSVRLPGRHVCECLGQKHKLINNCLHCGRIVCEQEGSGPCYFCGEVVCTLQEQELLARNSKRSQKLKEKLLESWSVKTNEDEEEVKRLAKATELKDRLLEYDRTSVRRTKVIDDESDYFASDSKWLSKKERKVLKEKEEKLQQLKHRSRRDMKVTLDFAGRRVTEGDVTDEMNDLYRSAEEYLESTFGSNNQLSHPNYVAEPPVYVEASQKAPGSSSRKTGNKSKGSSQNTPRIQDKELQEMSDIGQCLSMHQPWASLLVYGIKKAEGRVWYTTHRGRLWIAATAKQPSREEIAEMENYYRALGVSGRFPEHYPSGCLLGCVDVVDCLPQTEYQDKFPDGEESGSPFVFVVENPRELLVKFPIKGQHKIWKLDKHIHQAAKKGLR